MCQPKMSETGGESYLGEGQRIAGLGREIPVTSGVEYGTIIIRVGRRIGLSIYLISRNRLTAMEICRPIRSTGEIAI